MSPLRTAERDLVYLLASPFEMLALAYMSKQQNPVELTQARSRPGYIKGSG